MELSIFTTDMCFAEPTDQGKLIIKLDSIQPSNGSKMPTPEPRPSSDATSMSKPPRSVSNPTPSNPQPTSSIANPNSVSLKIKSNPVHSRNRCTVTESKPHLCKPNSNGASTAAIWKKRIESKLSSQPLESTPSPMYFASFASNDASIVYTTSAAALPHSPHPSVLCVTDRQTDRRNHP